MFGSNCSVPLVASIDGNNNGNSMFGGDGWWAIIIFALIFGWGGNGFGGFGGFGGNRNGVVEPCATQADVRAAVDQQTLISKLDNQTYGIADASYALNNSIMSGFHGVDNAICALGYQNQQGFSNLASQMASCCCETQRAIDGVNYNMATQACDTRNLIQNTTRDIIDNANANNRAILDFLVNDKIASLQAENQNLKLKASQAEQNNFIAANQQAQTAELIRRLGADCPVNAYVVQPPTPVTFPTNCCGGVSYANFGYNNGGCGCGCA
jgi:hypothetical protein